MQRFLVKHKLPIKIIFGFDYCHYKMQSNSGNVFIALTLQSKI
jgi:hypothetical protein